MLRAKTSVSNNSPPGPVHVHLPFDDIEDEASTESASSCSSVLSMASACDVALLSRSGSVRSTTTHSGSLRPRKSTESITRSESWPSRKPPILRLATPSPLETIPASPGWTPQASTHSQAPSNPIDEHDIQRFTIRPHADLSPDSSPTPPSFVIPSSNFDRRNKMERLRRRLGDDVPVDLVFPRETGAANRPSPVLEKTLPPLPVKAGSQRISSARDSISYNSPHHARRKPVPTKTTTPLNFRANDVRVRPEKRHYVKGQHSLRASIDMRDTKAKLCVIVESPDEHGSSWSEEFGIGRYPSVLESKWYMSNNDEAEVKKWSTRRGYEGWAGHVGIGEPRRRSYRKPPMTP